MGGTAILPHTLIPLAAQHGGKVQQVLQFAGGQEGSLVKAAAEVLPHVLLLQALEDVVHLQHGAQALLLHLGPHHLLASRHLLLGPKKLQRRNAEEQRLRARRATTLDRA